MKEHRNISIREVARIFSERGAVLDFTGKYTAEMLSDYWNFCFHITDTFFEANKVRIAGNNTKDDYIPSYVSPFMSRKYCRNTFVLKMHMHNIPFIVHLHKEGLLDSTISNFMSVYEFVYDNIDEIASQEGVNDEHVYKFVYYLPVSTYMGKHKETIRIKNVVRVSNMSEVENRLSGMYKEILGDYKDVLFFGNSTIVAKSNIMDKVISILMRNNFQYYELIEDAVSYVEPPYELFYLDGLGVKTDVGTRPQSSIIDGFAPHIRERKINAILSRENALTT